MRSKFKWIFTLLLAFSMQFSFAQEKTVTGTVTEGGLPLPGVSVVVKGTTRGTQTDMDGNYSIKAKAGEVLVFSFIGMKDATAAVGASNSINITMASEAKQLENIVIGAMGIKKRSDAVTSSFQVVKTKEITQAANPNVVQSLAGKVSGLQINTTNNSVNATNRIVIRNNKSITGNNQALVVIDGAISTADVLQSLAPNVIESVNVMKGAQGAALYGSDGVNGVIVVTTKKGAGDQKFTVGINSSIDFQTIAYLPERQTRYGAGWNGVYYTYENGGWGPEFDGTEQPIGLPQADGSYFTAPFSSRGSDNIKEFFRTGNVMQNNVTISTSDATSYMFFSANATKNEFVVEGDQLDRKNFLFKAGKKLGKISVDGNVNYTTSKDQTASSFLFYELLQAPTNVPVGMFANSGNAGHWTQYAQNPYWMLQNDRNENRNDLFVGGLRLQYDINKNINVSYNTNVRFTQNNGVSFTTAYVDPYDIYDMSTPSDFQTWNGNRRAIYADLMLNFDYDLTDAISFKLNLGNNIQDNMNKVTSVGGNNLVIPGLYTVGNLESSPSLVNNVTDNDSFRQRQYSYFANVDLGYKDFLFLNLTGRNDVISTLPKDNNSYFYPSAGLSFIPTKAFDGIKGDILNYAKISANYTKVGRADIDPYVLEQSYNTAGGFPLNVPSFLQSTAITDPNLKPEFFTTTELNVGLGFFNDRLTIDAAAYKSENKDLITSVAPSYASGLTSSRINIGKAETKGFEIDLGFTPIRTENFKWENKLSYSTSKMTVLKVTDQTNSVPINTGYAAANSSSTYNVGIYAEEGEEFPLIKGTAYVRDDQGRVIVDPETGMPEYSLDYKKLGKATPDYILGYNTSFEYKGIRLAAVLDYRTGHQFFSQAKSVISTFGYLVESAEGGRSGFIYPNSVTDTNNDGVYEENTSVVTGGNTYTSFQEYYATNYNEVAENFVLDATAFKVRELALSYNFNQKLLKGTGLQTLNLGVNARNPLTVLPKANRGYADPESSVTNGNGSGFAYIGSYPTIATYGFSLNLTF